MPAKCEREEELIPILEKMVIPNLERFKLEHFAATAKTLAEFNAQPLSPFIRTWVKKRCGKRKVARGKRYYGNISDGTESWPEDGQEVIRYPVLTYVVKGEADFHIGDYVVQCPQGHFLLLSPGVPQPDGMRPHLEGDHLEHRYCEVLWFVALPGTSGVAASICYSKGEKHWHQGEFDHCLVSRPEVVEFFTFFTREIIEKPKDYSKTAQASLYTFLLLFLRELEKGQFYHTARSALHANGDSSSSIGMAQQYINNHINAHLTTATVASAVFMSRTNFMQRFQQETGQTFKQYLTELRLEEAKRLLESNWSVQMVCKFVGLQPAQFRNLFKKRFGTPPSHFKRLHS